MKIIAKYVLLDNNDGMMADRYFLRARVLLDELDRKVVMFVALGFFPVHLPILEK